MLILAGAGIVAGGFGYDLVFAGLPYQDPTPDLQASWSFHSGLAEAIQGTGVVLIVLGSGISVVRRLFRR